MKKIFIFALILCLFFTSCEFDKSNVAELQSQTVDSTSKTVYITNTGSKYHKSSCGYLSKSKISISKDKAVNQGYTSCSKCKP